MESTSREDSDRARSGRLGLAVCTQTRREEIETGTSASVLTGVCATLSNLVPIGSAARGSGLEIISSAVSEERS